MAAESTNDEHARNRQAGVLLLGLVVILGLYAEEAVHYKHSLYGIHEYYIVRNLGNSPGCRPRRGNPRELICPLPGYNNILLGCLDSQCTYRDQDATEITPQGVEDYRRRNLAEFGKMPDAVRTWDQIPTNDKQR